MNNIVIIICYFGKLPWYFKYFVKSVQYNLDVDFLIISDAQFPEGLPSNIRIYPCSLGDVRVRASETLGFEVALNNSYKLCDFKPTYGLLFADLISSYGFWGHGDLDVIYGNIRSFISDKLLQENDIISVRKEYVSGFFAIFRNTIEMVNLFKLSSDYKRVYQEDLDFCFDECNWEWFYLMQGKPIFELKTEIESMTQVVRRLEQTHQVKAHFQTLVVEGLVDNLEWDKGQLKQDDGSHVLLYHLIAYKKELFHHEPFWPTVPDKFYINLFSFSRHSSRSLLGLTTRTVVYGRKIFTETFISITKYIQWLWLLRRGSVQIKTAEFPSYEAFAGVYRFQDVSLTLFNEEGRMFGAFDDGKRFELIHVKSNEFILRKYLQFRVRFIRIYFHFDSEAKKHFLIARPIEHERFFLYKT